MSDTNMTTKSDRGSRGRAAERTTYVPPVDIFENKDEILILADVPGITPDGLTINLERNELTIEARRDAQRAEDAVDYRRVFVVPHGLEADKISASLNNGVLRLALPKPAAMKPRQIAVTAG